MESKLTNRVSLIYAVRLRKALDRQRDINEDELKAGIKSILPTRFWTYLGYKKLSDFLTRELNMTIDSVADLVTEAIKLKIEDKGLYE